MYILAILILLIHEHGISFHLLVSLANLCNWFLYFNFILCFAFLLNLLTDFNKFFFLVESLKGFYTYVLCRAGHWVHTSEHCNTLLQWQLLSNVEAFGLFKVKAAGTLCSAGNWGPWWYLVWLTLTVLTPLFPSQLQTPQLSTSPQKSYECGCSPFFAPLYCCPLGASQGHLPSWTAVWLFFYWPRDKGCISNSIILLISLPDDSSWCWVCFASKDVADYM